MYLRSWLRSGASLLLVLSLLLSGCAKRVLVEEGTFEAQEKVVLSFSEGRWLEGRIDNGSKVRYRDAGSAYRATIQSVSEETIVLEDAILERSTESVEEAAFRLADARIVLGEPVPKIVLLRSEIESVEKVRFDGTKTLRNVSFWTLSSTILGLLLSERS